MESQTKLSRREKTGMIVRYLRGCWGFFAGAVVLAWMNTACNALVPQIISFTVDSVLGGEPPDLPGFLRPLIPVDQLRAEPLSFLWLAAGAVVLAAAVRGVCIYGMRINLAKGSEDFVKGLRDGLYSHIQRLSFAWHTAHATGDIIQRCTSDVEVIRTFVCNQLMEVVRTVFLIVLYSSIMVAMNWRLAMVSLAFIPISLLASWVFYGKISTRFKAADEAEGELTTCTQENLTGVRVVRAFGREKFEIDRFGEKNDHFSALWVELGRLLSVYWASGAFLTAAQVMAVIVAGTVEAVEGGLSLGDFQAFVIYNSAMAWPVRSLGRVLSDMSKAGVSLDRVGYILQAGEEKDGPQAKAARLSGDIVFDHVTFGYEGQEVLRDVSFTIPWGSTFAILGGTGSGKSTLVHLLDRLYDLGEGQGRITIGGTDIRDISRGELRRQIGLVLQEPFLFSQTIRHKAGRRGGGAARLRPDRLRGRGHHGAGRGLGHGGGRAGGHPVRRAEAAGGHRPDAAAKRAGDGVRRFAVRRGRGDGRQNPRRVEAAHVGRHRYPHLPPGNQPDAGRPHPGAGRRAGGGRGLPRRAHLPAGHLQGNL